MIIIADSSPLIALAVIGKLDLLDKLYEEIYVPNAVFQELAGNDKAFAKELRIFLTGKVKEVENRLAVDMLLCDIGAGEAEAIILALEQRPDAVLIDDLKARKFAKIRGLNIIGTLGILLKAKKAGLVREIRPLLEAMLAGNIRISQKIKEITLQAAQEIEL
jgi:predicted nucleic acid-binding protein